MEDKINFTKFQKRTELLSVIALCFLFMYIVSNWSSIPARIPSHYDMNGVMITNRSSKSSLLLLPVISLAIYALLTVVLFFPKTWNIPVKITDENRARVYAVTRSMLCVLKLLTMLLFISITVSLVKMREPWISFFIILFGGFFGVLGGFTVKIIKTSKPVDILD